MQNERQNDALFPESQAQRRATPRYSDITPGKRSASVQVDVEMCLEETVAQPPSRSHIVGRCRGSRKKTPAIVDVWGTFRGMLQLVELTVFKRQMSSQNEHQKYAHFANCQAPRRANPSLSGYCSGKRCAYMREGVKMDNPCPRHESTAINSAIVDTYMVHALNNEYSEGSTGRTSYRGKDGYPGCLSRLLGVVPTETACLKYHQRR